MGGCFGDWSSGLSEIWQAQRGTTFTATEQTIFQQRIVQARRQATTKRKASQENAAIRATRILQQASVADDNHPYLIRKGIRAHGIRQQKSKLLIPIYQNKKIQSIQFIDAAGKKQFLADGRIVGGYFSIGGLSNTRVVCIAEGFATGATIHQATGYPVVVAFQARNLVVIAQMIRRFLSGRQLILCADDDRETKGNVGVTNAMEAARIVNGQIAIPDFGAVRPEGVSDFNDLYQLHGLAAVARDIQKVVTRKQDHFALVSVKSPQSINTIGVLYRCIADIQPESIDWLWPGYLAMGKICMLAGNPGLGKSQVTIYIAAMVTVGGHWPVSKTPCRPGKVIILSAEDDPADTIRPRLEAVGADLSRVLVVDAVVSGNEQKPRGFNLKTDLSHLEKLLLEINDVSLIIIDPITAYLGQVDSHKNADIRSLLTPLTALAAKYKVAVLCVSHLNKGAGEAITRVTGSLAFVAATRSAFVVLKDKENPERRLLLPLKNNISDDQNGLAFRIVPTEIEYQKENIKTSRVDWESCPVTMTADDAMTTLSDSKSPSSIEDAKTFLHELLMQGSMSVNEVKENAKQDGYAWRTIQRAKKMLGIEAVKQGGNFGCDKKQQWVWQLPETLKDASVVEESQSDALASFNEFGNLQ